MKKLLAVFVLLILAVYARGTYGQNSIEQPLIYLLPAHGAQNVSPATTLAVRAGGPLAADVVDLESFVVTGSESGVHSGETVLSDDALTLIFLPDQPFEYGEDVTVTVKGGLTTADNEPITGTTYTFTTIPYEPDAQKLRDFLEQSEFAPGESPQKAVDAGQYPYFTHPEFNVVMTTTVTSPAQNTADGYIFVGALEQGYNGPATLMALEDSGEPVYIEIVEGGPFIGDFKKQTVNGTDYLTYHAGIIPGGYTQGASYVLDENYQVVDTWTVANGFGSDTHEFLLLDNGHAILMAYLLVPFDLRPYGGPENGTLVEIILQEQDSNKNVVFEWIGSQHMPIEQTEVEINTTGPVDFLHTNAIAVDDDGNWLLSHRNFSEITKINRMTGEIIWRMGGGAGNEFTFINDEGFYNQHNVSRIDNGNITLFDNGNHHSPPVSRAVEYAINETTKTATLVWMYEDAANTFSSAMGSAQRLPNGNTMIGWGNQPKISEVGSDGSLALELLLSSINYRAFRFPWSGTPLEAPRAVIQYGPDPTAVTIYTSWNGATDITGYDIYAGATMGSLALVGNAARTGFETKIDVTGLPDDSCFFRTKPVHGEGNVTPFSNLMFRVDLEVCWDQLEHSFMPAVRK